jgi:hypothetical protein
MMHRSSTYPSSKAERMKRWIRDNVRIGGKFVSKDLCKVMNMEARGIGRVLHEWEGDLVSITHNVHDHSYTRLK